MSVRTYSRTERLEQLARRGVRLNAYVTDRSGRIARVIEFPADGRFARLEYCDSRCTGEERLDNLKALEAS